MAYRSKYTRPQDHFGEDNKRGLVTPNCSYDEDGRETHPGKRAEKRERRYRRSTGRR